MSQMAVHAAPNLNIPEVADPVAESLNAGVGKGENCLYRPSTFVSAYRQVFDQNRGVFGSQAALRPPEKEPQSPLLMYKHSHEHSVNKTPIHSKHTAIKENSKKLSDDKTDNNKDKNIESPRAPPRKQQFVGVSQSRDQSRERTVNLKRHKSFHEDNKNSLEQRKTKYFAEPATIKPSDVLKTPYLLPTVSNNFNNFPQITSTSMVSKAKALFEGKERSQGFVPLTKSRTFSCFPTDIGESSTGDCPLTPSVPKRKSSKTVMTSYKSMNSNMNSCGMESLTASPMIERRIPMRNFF